MNKFSKTLLLTGSLLVSAIGGANALTLAEAADATYPIYDGTRRVCSATAVSPTQLVTAYHCIDGNKDKDNSISIGLETLDDKQKVLSQTFNYTLFVRTDKKKDVALIELKDKSMRLNQYVEMCDDVKDLKMGDPLWAIGYPKGLEKTLTDGLFSSKVDMENLTRGDWEGVFYKTTIPMTGGNSGGGLYRQMDNDVYGNAQYCYTGTASAGWPDVSFMTYFSPLESAEFITKNLLTFDKGGVESPSGSIKPAEKSSNLPKAGGSIDEM